MSNCPENRPLQGLPKRSSPSAPQYELNLKTKSFTENVLKTSYQAAPNSSSNFEVLLWLLVSSSDPGVTPALMEEPNRAGGYHFLCTGCGWPNYSPTNLTLSLLLIGTLLLIEYVLCAIHCANVLYTISHPIVKHRILT